MRQKRLKYVSKELLATHGVIVQPSKINVPDKPIHLEIGSGKGQFITRLAQAYPDIYFVAMEVNINVCYRILEKKEAMNLTNLAIIYGDAGLLDQYFAPHQIDMIYLNFSDPWPKKKHHKRRLTAPSFLKMYTTIQKPDGLLQFRTDHLDLFEDSIQTISTCYTIIDLNRNLNISEFMTEYEEKKRQDGPIYQLTGKVINHAE